MLRVVLLSSALAYAFAKVHMAVIQRKYYFRQALKCWVFDEDPMVPMVRQATTHAFTSVLGTEERTAHPVQETDCDDTRRHQFLISDDQVSTIRPALRPDLCVEAPETIVRPSFLRFRRCSGLANQSFVLPKLSTFYHDPDGSICTPSNPDVCVGQLQTFESCLRSWQMNCYTGILGVSDATSFNASSEVRNVPTSWYIITAHPDMWFGSRVAETIIYKALLWYLICCAAGYTIYVLCIFRRFICKARSLGAPILWLRGKFVEAKSVLDRIYRAICASSGTGSSKVDLIRLMDRRRLQRTQVYSRKLFHVSSCYLFFKAHQLWQDHVEIIECSDHLSACSASAQRMHVYNFEMFPMFTMFYPALVILTFIGDKIRPRLCDMLVGVLYVAWCFRCIMDSKETWGFTAGKVLFCRICQMVVLGNPRLAAICELIVYVVSRAFTYGVCSGKQWEYPDGAPYAMGCPDTKHFIRYALQADNEKTVELIIMFFVASFMYAFDSVQAKEIIARRRGDARELALRLLQSHLDVLYDCVVHLGESFEITKGAPKLAGLLMRGAINEHSLKDRYLVDLMAEGERQRFDEHMKNTCLSDRVAVLHVSFVDGDGGVVPCELFASSAADDDGTRTYMLGIKEIERDFEAPPKVRDHIILAHPTSSPSLGNEVEHNLDALSATASGAGSYDRGIMDEAASHSESSLDDMNLRLAVDWGVLPDVMVVGCTQRMNMALGKEMQGTLVNKELANPAEFKVWLQESLCYWQEDLDPPPLKIFFKASRWRPYLSAMLYIEDFAPAVDENRRVIMEVRRLRRETNKFWQLRKHLPLRGRRRQVSSAISL